MKIVIFLLVLSWAMTLMVAYFIGNSKAPGAFERGAWFTLQYHKCHEAEGTYPSMGLRDWYFKSKLDDPQNCEDIKRIEANYKKTW